MKLFLAGCEVFSVQKIAQDNDLAYANQFYTFMYHKNASSAVKRFPGKLKVCDSGAHSFFAMAGEESNMGIPVKKTSGKVQESPEAYVKRYIGWIQEHWDYFDYFVELDIQDLVGYDTVKTWRQWYKDAGIETKMIWCFHECNTWQEYLDMVDTCPARYLGLEGVRTRRTPLEYNKYIRVAYENNVKVHGFAMIKHKYLMEYPFYSVDSSSWTSAYRFGATMEFDKVRQRMTPKVVKKSTKWMLDKNIPIRYMDSYNDDVVREKILVSIEGYRQYEEYLTKLWEKRGIVWKD